MGKIKISIFYTLTLIVGLVFSSSVVKAQSSEEAINLLETEKFDAATSTIKKAIEKNPGDGANHFYAGYIYLKLEKPDSAKLHFDKGASVDPKAPLPLVGQGWIALNNNNIQQAQGFFDKAIDLSKGKDQLVFNRIAEALIYADNKDPNKALSYLNKALTLKKNKNKEKAGEIDAQTHILMGDAYLAAKDGGKAITSYERAITANPKIAPQAHAKIGRIYLIPKNYEAAEGEFQKAIQADPNYAPVYKDLGELYFKKRDIDKAQEMYNKYGQLLGSEKSVKQIGIFSYLKRDYPAAVENLQKALQVDQNDLVVNRLLGYSLNKMGDSVGAKQALDKYFSLVKPDKTLATDYINYGEVLMNLGEDSLAVQNYLIAIDKDTANIELIEEVAENLRINRKNEAAAKMYDVLLAKKASPTTNDYYRAGTVYVQAKQFAKADSAYAKVIEATPDNYLGYSALALSKFYQESAEGGELGLAKPHYEKLISLLEADPNIASEKNKKSALLTAYQYMASYYTQKEDLKSAGAYWEKVDQVDPGNPNAKKFKEYLIEVAKYNEAQKKAQKQKAGK